ncbi:MAG: hypothetical protein EXR61_05000 [Chloroflexi bacterium]|nr:hypothetical protein [Chloroflexota bacterium]
MRSLWSLAATVLIVAACGTPAPATSASQALPLGAVAPDAAAAAPGAPAAPAVPAVAPLPAYLATTLTDVRSGARFTLGDFRGKVTIVEGMAVW